MLHRFNVFPRWAPSVPCKLRGPMDLLSDVLRVIKLDSAIYFNAEYTEP